MSAGYGFLSVLRRGLAAKIGDDPSTEPRARITTTFSMAGQAVSGLPAVALLGPGDIVGFDAASVRRAWPTAGATDAEPGYFPLVEFADADLPWRYTPAATNGDRLTPWLCLIVVKDTEAQPLVAATRDRPLAVLSVTDAGALPDLSQAWAWAHAQLLGTDPATPDSVATLLAATPQNALARLLCPRRLDPQTSYLACVVPVFERGRLAGLGKPVAGVDRAMLAWSGAAPVDLPVYYSWRFQTGDAGDFASLVHKLVACKELPDAAWERDLAISPPGAQPPAWQVTKLAGALMPLDTEPPAWAGGAFTDALVTLVNDANPRELAPPLYGRWLAKTAQLSTSPTAAPAWFHQLNGDPRARVAAGLGTLVVQAQEQTLLAQAWAQADAVRRANQQLRLTQLAREVATRLYQRHFSISGDAALQVTAPVHAKIRSGTTTIKAQLAASPIVPGAIGARWRRASRLLGSLRMRQAGAAQAATSALARMNTGALALVPFTKISARPDHISTTTTVTTTTVTTNVTPRSRTTPPVAAIATLDTAAIEKAATALSTQFQTASLQPGIQWVSADLDGIHQTVLAQLHPKHTIEQPMAARLTGFVAGPKRTDPLEPVMAAPAFPQATYEPLRDESQSWILPGLDQVPANSVAVLRTNWAFVEAFLVGMNHEMARKLLWNGYPTDQRGTYFRTFWDARGSVGDIGPIHGWTAALGKNRTGTDPLVLLVRGDLIRRYPNTVVYAAAGVPAAHGTRAPGPTEKQPLFYARLQPDVALYAFDLDRDAVRGNPGWFFVLQEHPSEPRFGLATPGTAWGAQPATWQALGWDHLAASAAALESIHYIDLAAALPLAPQTADTTGAVWHADASRAGDLAHITFRTPQQLAIHASLLVPARS